MSDAEPPSPSRTTLVALAVVGLIMIATSGYDLAAGTGDGLKDVGFVIAGAGLLVGAWARDRGAPKVEVAASVMALGGVVLPFVRLFA